MKTVRFDKTNYRTALPQALTVFRAGGLVIYPTETCYGIGVDATNPQAVQKLLAYKGGRENKAISVAVTGMQMAQDYVEINEIAKNIYTTLLPGPVTVISKDKGKVAKGLVSDMGTLGIRIPDYPLLLRLLTNLGKPVTATSANTSGQKPPYSLEEWQKYTSIDKQNQVDLFLDVGNLPIKPPSTLVDTTLNELTVLRQGEIMIPHSARTFGSFTPQETEKIGEEIIRSNMHILADKALIIALQGELGAGKTQLTKGVAKALGITELVKSPTYTIVREYELEKGKMFHLDTWRLHEGKELWGLGFEEMLKPGNVIVIEWLQKMKAEFEKLKKSAEIVWIDIEGINETERKIRLFKA